MVMVAALFAIVIMIVAGHAVRLGVEGSRERVLEQQMQNDRMDMVGFLVARHQNDECRFGFQMNQCDIYLTSATKCDTKWLSR